MVDETATIISNTTVAPGLWELTLALETIPKLVVPGQFVHVQLGEKSEFTLRRPLSVYAVCCDDKGELTRLILIYQVVGRGTEYLTTYKKNETLQIFGPIGRGWQPPQRVTRALLVGGGVGCAPLSPLTDNLLASGAEVHLLMGAQNATLLQVFSRDRRFFSKADDQGDMIAASEGAMHHASFFLENAEESVNSLSSALRSSHNTGAAAGMSCYEHYATDDGSMGYHGFTTGLMPTLLARYEFDYIATCGPEPMQRIVASAAAQAAIPCEVSLERRMACGIGACLSCVVNTVHGKKRACVDGPVFDGQEVCW